MLAFTSVHTASNTIFPYSVWYRWAECFRISIQKFLSTIYLGGIPLHVSFLFTMLELELNRPIA